MALAARSSFPGRCRYTGGTATECRREIPEHGRSAHHSQGVTHHEIQTNTAANSALGYMRVNNQATERSIQKLSSGFRINRAADDAAGLAIANKLRSDIRGLGQAQKNVMQGSAMLQVMDGATQTVGTILDRMKELATQANSANVGTQADKLQKEFTQLRSEIDRIVTTTKYQGTSLVDGTFGYTTGAGTPPSHRQFPRRSLRPARATSAPSPSRCRTRPAPTR